MKSEIIEVNDKFNKTLKDYIEIKSTNIDSKFMIDSRDGSINYYMKSIVKEIYKKIKDDPTLKYSIHKIDYKNISKLIDYEDSELL